MRKTRIFRFHNHRSEKFTSEVGPTIVQKLSSACVLHSRKTITNEMFRAEGGCDVFIVGCSCVVVYCSFAGVAFTLRNVMVYVPLWLKCITKFAVDWDFCCGWDGNWCCACKFQSRSTKVYVFLPVVCSHNKHLSLWTCSNVIYMSVNVSVSLFELFILFDGCFALL